MGAFLEKPKTEKAVSDGEAKNLRWGVSAMQGWRLEMEDAHTCETKLPLEGCSFFAVFDGHAGSNASQFCAKHLLDEIVSSVKLDIGEENLKKAVKESFLKVDSKLKGSILDQKQPGGTTAVMCLVTPNHFIWANCGDSRGLLCRGGKLEYTTVDHKPMNEQERQRIEKAGGTVMMQRVNGSLAVSRALGDFDYKRIEGLQQIEQLVSPEPDVHIVPRLHEDQFLLLACDGVYDVMTNDEIIAYVLHHLKLESKLSKICSDLIDTCLNKNSRDNMSVVLVTFPSAPTVSQEAIEEEKERTEKLRDRICERLEELARDAQDAMDLEENYLLQHLQTELCGQFPGVYNEREFIVTKIKEKKGEKFGKENSETAFEEPQEPPADFGAGQGTDTPGPVDLGMSATSPMEVEPSPLVETSASNTAPGPTSTTTATPTSSTSSSPSSSSSVTATAPSDTDPQQQKAQPRHSNKTVQT